MSSMLQLHFDARGSLREAARACEQDVFLATFGNSRQQLADEYGPYEDQSVFLAVSDEKGSVLGSCRLILPGPAGLKTLNDVGREPWLIDGARAARAAGVDPSRAWDIGTLGVRDGHRGRSTRVSLALFHAVLKSTYLNNVPSVTSILDERARRVFAAFDYVYSALPSAATAAYLGSAASTPVYCHASMVDIQRRVNPEAYRLLSLGIGLDGLSTPADAEYLIVPRGAQPAFSGGVAA